MGGTGGSRCILGGAAATAAMGSWDAVQGMKAGLVLQEGQAQCARQRRCLVLSTDLIGGDSDILKDECAVVEEHVAACVGVVRTLSGWVGVEGWW